MKNKKLVARIKSGVLVLVCCLQVCLSQTGIAYAAPEWPVLNEEIDSAAAIVIDADSGAVLYEKNADETYIPASTTKIMTALLVMEKCSLDEIVEFSDKALIVESGGGGKINFSAGDKMTVKDCLYALILESSNLAANALAEHVAGDMDSFAVMMNDKLKELGLTKSHFDNPSGLNGDTQVVTARELALIAKAAYENPTLLEISKAYTYDLPPLQELPNGYTVENDHRLVTTANETSDTYYPPAVAGKPGYLKKSGNTAITYAEQDGRKLITVVLKGVRAQYFVDCKKMFIYGFANFENHIIPEQTLKTFSDSELQHLRELGSENSLLSVSGDIAVTLPKDTSLEDIRRNITALPEGKHPVNAIALLQYTYQNKVVGTAYITDATPQTAAESLPDDQSRAQSPSGEAGDGQQNDSPGSKDTKPAGKSNGLIIFLIILLLVTAGGLVAVFFYFRQMELENRKERQKKRRMRLEEMGISQEQFEEMKHNRRKKS